MVHGGKKNVRFAANLKKACEFLFLELVGTSEVQINVLRSCLPPPTSDTAIHGFHGYPGEKGTHQITRNDSEPTNHKRAKRCLSLALTVSIGLVLKSFDA